jgi:Cell cycle protein/Penicillin binding protein transpeptidase domain
MSASTAGSGNLASAGQIDERSTGSLHRTHQPLLPLLAPTAVMVGLTLLLLVVQRDLGTAVIFIFLYVVIAFLATGRAILLVAGGLLLTLAGAFGYLLFDVVRLRIDAWLNPWLDPSGRSYQIVQSLLAMANGGLGGRGPGLGNPGLVPIAQSDFIYAAIVEEGGLVWAIGLICLLGILVSGGLRIALQAPGGFYRYLAAGLTVYLVGQSILIVGGNLRLLPLTGVTLPFVSYGGSSLLTAFLSLWILLFVSSKTNTVPGLAPNPRHYLFLGGFVIAGLAAVALATGWWAIYRGPALLGRTDNPRRAISDRYVPRGLILDRRSTPLAVTEGTVGELTRRYEYPQLSPLIGYNDPVYGQSGLEASLDPFLRGLSGNDPLVVWWHHLLYGQPPPGRDVRLSLDLDLQRKADELLGDQTGALVLLNASSGEVLAIASHPNYDSNHLSEDWDRLIADPHTPLIDRATQGSYPAGIASGPFLLAAIAQAELPDLPVSLDYTAGELDLPCASPVAGDGWSEAIRAGCPGALAALVEALGDEATLGLFNKLQVNLVEAFAPGLEGASEELESESPLEAIFGLDDLRLSPLQMALSAAAISADGTRPPLRLAMAVNLPGSGWAVLPAESEISQIIPPGGASSIAGSLQVGDLPAWGSLARGPNASQGIVTWYLSGTSPGWNGTPLALVVLLETDDPALAEAIGQGMMRAALQVE